MSGYQGYSFLFSQGDIVMTAYGMILLRHENTLTIVCQIDWYKDFALQFWYMVY